MKITEKLIEEYKIVKMFLKLEKITGKAEVKKLKQKYVDKNK